MFTLDSRIEGHKWKIGEGTLDKNKECLHIAGLQVWKKIPGDRVEL